MNNYLTYSILQYKHSLSLGEVLNVGILFYFPEDKKFEFAIGDATRLKAVYPNFDNSLFNAYLKTIKDKLKASINQSAINLFSDYPSVSDFGDFIHRNILAVDAAGLVFSTPAQVKNVFSNRELAVKEYSKLLLPGVNTVKPVIVKHNESYLISQFEGYLSKDKKEIVSKLNKNVVLETKHFKHKFDFSWQSSTQNYIKPLSFDLTDENSIMNKAFQYYGHLADLNSYFKSDIYSFDLLIAKPQDSSLKRSYENALDILDSSKVSKQLITETKILNYTQTVVHELFGE